jgi:hypothetical protein
MSTRIGQWRRAHPRLSAFIVAALVLGLVVAAIAKWRADYLGPGPGVADRIAAAHDPLVVGVGYGNPFQGKLGTVGITLKSDATRDQVNAFWCDVVVPAGGAPMYRDGWLGMGPETYSAAPWGQFLPALECPPTPDPRPWNYAGQPDIPRLPVHISCTGLDDCDRAVTAIHDATDGLQSHPWSIEISAGGFHCSNPFPATPAGASCEPLPYDFTAYVTFYRDETVVALRLVKVADGYKATTVAIADPPAMLERYLWMPSSTSSPGP